MMNLVALSDADVEAVHSLFRQFHEGYTPFFQVHTKNVAKSAIDYLHGQLFTQQQMNMIKFCREVPESESQAMQHFIADSPWTDVKLIGHLREDVCQLLGDPIDGALILDESGIPKQGKMSVGVARQYCGRLGKSLP
ncbi:MAG: transposase [Candidatus Poribacteria bacterium]|nr:transposase [Candidatus Poribacteria bacterium]